MLCLGSQSWLVADLGTVQSSEINTENEDRDTWAFFLKKERGRAIILLFLVPGFLLILDHQDAFPSLVGLLDDDDDDADDDDDLGLETTE